MVSSFKPFLISEFPTGLFNYLEPWIRPNDAFEPLVNAYVYRGSVYKRDGDLPFGNTGRLRYEDCVTLATGDGAHSTYSGTLSNHPITSGTFTIEAKTAGGMISLTDNGDGTLSGNMGSTGTINYTSGAWTVNFNGNNVSNGYPVIGCYIYTPTLISSPVSHPIMAIKQFIDETNNFKFLVVCDTRRACVFNNNTFDFDPLNLVSQTLWVGQSGVTSINLNVGWGGIVPYSVTISDSVDSMTDDGIGGFPGAGNMLNTSTINYTTGAITLNITAANTRTYTITLELAGDYFTGNSSNFFNSTNWKPTNSSTAYLYLTNNVDRVTLFDGTNLSRPPFPITLSHQGSFTNDITTCLDIKVYKNRLLLLRPTIVGTSSPDAQSIRYSALFNPFNFVADVAGNGGEISAPTSDWIQASQFLRDTLIVFFQDSTWTFRFTNSSVDPFRWDKINSSKSTNAPYATIDYDERITSMGAKGLIACDGVNVQRYDLPIIDQFEDINQDAFQQCFGQRYDVLNQSWMLYPSEENNSSVSDKVLIYNFIENTWATYDLSLSCLGLYFGIKDVTWDDFAVGTPLGTQYPDWDSADFTWNSFLNQSLAPVLLGGSNDGIVYELNNGVTDNGTAITTTITSTRWNPFVGLGQRTQFGYIDIYYQVNPGTVATFNFYVNNSDSVAASRILTMDGPTSDDVAWKRIYINLIGEFIRMEMTSSSTSSLKIVGMILWADQAGRLTP